MYSSLKPYLFIALSLPRRGGRWFPKRGRCPLLNTPENNLLALSCNKGRNIEAATVTLTLSLSKGKVSWFDKLTMDGK